MVQFYGSTTIGGVFDSGFVLVWAFLGPLCSLMLFPLKQSVFWFLLYLSNLVITVVFNDYFVTHGQEAAPTIRLVFFILNLSIASIVVFIFAGYYVIAAKREREKANTLLLNVLPKEIAPVLKSNNGHTIADSYPSASVLFADMIGSTPLFETMKPTAAVDWLNEVFSMFDKLVDRYGLENIRTIGDNYMVASGVPTHRKDHAHTLAKLALEMVDGINQIPARNGHQMQFRLGINSGPLVAGVIGKTKFHYDVWGDVVNTAARMESHGQAGKIQIGPGTYELINDEFRCIPRGEINVKGKGPMRTWYLEGFLPQSDPAPERKSN